MAIKVSQERITHYYAMCNCCGWNEADHVDRQRIRNMVAKHIRDTGHSVTIEKAVSVLYEPTGAGLED